MKEIVTIILNWNKPEMTIKTFENIQEIEKNKTDFIIIDNGSEVSEKEKLINYAKKNNWRILNEGDEILEKNENKNVEVILYNLNKNYGYAKGNNFGLKLADFLGYKYAVVANNDVILEEEVMEKLLHVILSNEDICVVGPRVIGPNGKRQGPFSRPNVFSEFLYPIFYFFIYPFHKLFTILYEKKISKNEVVYPYRLMGCFMLIKLDCMKEIGFFDESTFLYAEEPILSEKLKLIGKKTAYRNDVYVKHLHGVSTIEYGEKKRFLLQLNSDLYYFKEYRKYGKIRLFLVKMGRYYSFFILNPIKKSIKNTLKYLKRR